MIEHQVAIVSVLIFRMVISGLAMLHLSIRSINAHFFEFRITSQLELLLWS